MATLAIDYERLGDLELAAAVLRRDVSAIRLLMRRNHQRLYRAAWCILRNRAEAEDAVQEAYLKAFAAMGSFAGEAALSTWLTRIAVNEALERRRTAARRARLLQDQSIAVMDDYRGKFMSAPAAPPTPDADLMHRQIKTLLEEAIAKLPQEFRTVFVLREIEGLSVEETADALQIPVATVKTRALRARRRLQAELDADLREALSGTFPFAGADCDRLTERVLAKWLSTTPAG
jgi:RNA polymerase sigma-70 factor (ECF subfamily)